jgi:regulatory protein
MGQPRRRGYDALLIPRLASRATEFYASCMFRKPRKLETESELYDAALRALMRRPHSVHEMKKLLGRRCEEKLMVQLVLARLRENGQIDDSRYAKQFAHQRTANRKQGKFRVARDLRARGVPDSHITTALEDAGKETDEAATIRERIHRKLRLTRGEIDDKKIASLFRSLLRLGFPSDLIRRELRAATREDVPEVEPAEDA